MTSAARCQNLEQREAYLRGICSEAKAKGVNDIKGWHENKELFASDLDFGKLVRYSQEVKEGGNLDGPALTSGEMVMAVIEAIKDKNLVRGKGGLGIIALVTTENILFEFYLIRRHNKASNQNKDR